MMIINAKGLINIQYGVKVRAIDLKKHRPCIKVTFKYLRTHLITNQCTFVGQQEIGKAY